MKPLGLNESGVVKHAKKTRKAKFNEVEPWSRRVALIDPDSPKAGNGCRPIGLERMWRIHVMPPWFAYADPAMEEALHDIPRRREFAGRRVPCVSSITGANAMAWRVRCVMRSTDFWASSA